MQAERCLNTENVFRFKSLLTLLEMAGLGLHDGKNPGVVPQGVDRHGGI
jgi:hypothetical protein